MLLTEAFVLQAQKKRHCFRQLLEPIWARRAVLTIPKLGRQVSQTVPFVQWSSMHAWTHIHALTLSADVNCMYYKIILLNYIQVAVDLTVSLLAYLFPRDPNYLKATGISWIARGFWIDKGIDDSGATPRLKTPPWPRDRTLRALLAGHWFGRDGPIWSRLCSDCSKFGGGWLRSHAFIAWFWAEYTRLRANNFMIY